MNPFCINTRGTQTNVLHNQMSFVANEYLGQSILNYQQIQNDTSTGAQGTCAEVMD